MAKSNDKKKRTDGVIPMKGKNVPSSLNSSNTATSFNSYSKKEKVLKDSKTNQLYWLILLSTLYINKRALIIGLLIYKYSFAANLIIPAIINIIVATEYL